jgi:competence protein ComEA
MSNLNQRYNLEEEGKMKPTNKVSSLALVTIICLAMATGLGWAMEGETVNINTADLEQLMSLERIGPKYAQRIIEYRENVSLFERPEDILKVPGIGQKTWEANKHRIVVTTPQG